jgi:hypothetical protein
MITLFNFQFNATYSHRFKTGIKYREFIKLNNVKPCQVINNMGSNDWLRSLLFAADSVVPGFVPKQCPISGVSEITSTIHNNPIKNPFSFQKVQIVNGSATLAEEDHTKMASTGLGFFPNGFFKINITVFDNLDDNIFKCVFVYENYQHENNLKFTNFRKFAA